MGVEKNINPEIIEKIRNGGIGVLPTDTLYGIVGSALNENAVQRIYSLRKRNSSKSMIILISSLNDLGFFDIPLEPVLLEKVKTFWPGKVSIILDCSKKEFHYLHRGGNSLAFRLPEDEWLRELLKQTGPLVAPSANLEGEKEAKDINQAREYFGESVDFYVDHGVLESEPSTIVRIKEGKLEIVRKGAVDIEEYA